MDTVQTTTAARAHIVWLDVLRLVAILMVIAIHCTDPFNASPESRADPEFNFWGSVYGSMLRASVPLFVMMTGFLLLPVRQEASAFYRKRIPRVLFPFLIWSVLFDLAPWFIQRVGGICDTDVVYLCADRALSVYAGLLRMGGKGIGQGEAYVSGALVCFVVYPLSDGVCLALPVRNLLMELIRAVLLFCRFQRISVVRALFREKNRRVRCFWQAILLHWPVFVI